MLNGYEELENFHDLDESELDYLGITEPAQRAKILTAVELMQDNTCNFLHCTCHGQKVRQRSGFDFLSQDSYILGSWMGGSQYCIPSLGTFFFRACQFFS